MLQNGLILFGVIVLGPVAVGLMLERYGLGSLWSTVGAGASLVGGVLLLQNPPSVGPRVSIMQDWIARSWPWPMATPSGPGIGHDTPSTGQLGRPLEEVMRLRQQLAALKAAAATAADGQARLESELEAEKAAHAGARRQLDSARQQAGASPAPRSDTSSPSGHPDALAALESERAAHAQTRLALKAVEDQVTALESFQARLAPDLAKAEAERQAAEKAAEDAQLRLVLAEATITRLQAAVGAIRAAGPPVEPSALPSPPAPFSSAPKLPDRAPAERPAATVAAIPVSGQAPLPVATGAVDHPIARKLAAGLSTSHLTLQSLASRELVQTRPGSYFRVVCREPRSARRLTFEPGNYVLTGAPSALDACVRDLQQAVLSELPSGAVAKLYVQAFASPQAFIRPQRLPDRDAHLRSIEYLPLRGAGQFAPTPLRHNVATTFTNKDLAVLRAGHIVQTIARTGSNIAKPVVVEGETRPASDEASKSFDLVLHVAW